MTGRRVEVLGRHGDGGFPAGRRLARTRLCGDCGAPATHKVSYGSFTLYVCPLCYGEIEEEYEREIREEEEENILENA